MPHKTGFQNVEYVLFCKYHIISLFDEIHSMEKVIKARTNLGNPIPLPKRKPTGNMVIFLLHSTYKVGQPYRLNQILT